MVQWLEAQLSQKDIRRSAASDTRDLLEHLKMANYQDFPQDAELLGERLETPDLTAIGSCWWDTRLIHSEHGSQT